MIHYNALSYECLKDQFFKIKLQKKKLFDEWKANWPRSVNQLRLWEFISHCYVSLGFNNWANICSSPTTREQSFSCLMIVHSSLSWSKLFWSYDVFPSRKLNTTSNTVTRDTSAQSRMYRYFGNDHEFGKLYTCNQKMGSWASEALLTAFFQLPARFHCVSASIEIRDLLPL